MIIPIVALVAGLLLLGLVLLLLAIRRRRKPKADLECDMDGLAFMAQAEQNTAREISFDNPGYSAISWA